MSDITQICFRMLRYGLLAFCSSLALAEVPGTEIEDTVRQHVEQIIADMPVTQGAARVDIRVQAVDSRLRLAECFTPLDLDAGEFQGFGRMTVRVSCRSPRPWVLYVPANVKVFREAVVTTTSIARGVVLESEHLALAETNILDTGGRHMEDLGLAVGMQTKRNLAAGSLVSATLLQAPTIIHRGEEVRVLARHGEVAVLASGTALGDGRQGEQIKVRNQQSERIIRAKVLGPGEVEVIL